LQISHLSKFIMCTFCMTFVASYLMHCSGYQPHHVCAHTSRMNSWRHQATYAEAAQLI
jgi:hypothetical protein